jgi:hypothetical protein
MKAPREMYDNKSHRQHSNIGESKALCDEVQETCRNTLHQEIISE